MSPLVSVCIPTYNNPGGLRGTLRNITGQTYTNLEIIVSDNCSPDPGVQEVIREFAETDTRIHPYRQDVWVNVNENYRFVRGKATGKYMMFAQDDDWWSRSFIEKLVEGLEANPDKAAAICPSQYVTSTGETSGVYDMHGLSPYWAVGNGKLGFICMGIWRCEMFVRYEAHLEVHVLGGDHITAAHMLMVHNGIVVADSENYYKGFKKTRFAWCFQNHDSLYMFRTWYHLMRILITSPYIPVHRKILLPVVGVTNLLRACAVFSVQVLLRLPEGNWVRKIVQHRFFGTN